MTGYRYRDPSLNILIFFGLLFFISGLVGQDGWFRFKWWVYGLVRKIRRYESDMHVIWMFFSVI